MEPRTRRGQTPLDDEAEQHRMPRWVRGFIAAGVIAVAIMVAVMIIGGSDHGPGRHQPDTAVETSTNHIPPFDHE